MNSEILSREDVLESELNVDFGNSVGEAVREGQDTQKLTAQLASFFLWI